MKWSRILSVWVVIVFAETVHGVLRSLYVAPMIGDLPARQIGVLSGSLLIFLITWLAIRWIDVRTTGDQIIVGAVWVILMGIFEFGMGIALGYPLTRIVSDYNVSEGGLMGFGLTFMLFAPLLAAKIRR